MTEPFLPQHRNNDAVDAADPGLGAPGSEESVFTDAELDSQIQQFEERLDEERGEPTTFRTPEVPSAND